LLSISLRMCLLSFQGRSLIRQRPAQWWQGLTTDLRIGRRVYFYISTLMVLPVAVHEANLLNLPIWISVCRKSSKFYSLIYGIPHYCKMLLLFYLITFPFHFLTIISILSSYEHSLLISVRFCVCSITVSEEEI
jgi:hypothetical protein